MKRILILLALCLSFAVAAQHKVLYKNQPLEEIIQDIEDVFHVRFAYNNSIVQSKVFSFSGTVTLENLLDEISEQHALAFEFLDEENIMVKASSKEMPIQLEEVLIVREYLTSGFDQNKKDGSVSLTPKKLGVLPGLTEPDVMQSLQLLPGVSSPTESASNLHIRGGTPDQNLVIWDGIKIYHQGHFFGMISAFNPYVTDRVDVYRSGASAKYGDRISGVIDMHSTNDVLQKMEVGGGVNLLQTDAFVKLPIVKDKLGVFVAARRSLSDVFDTRTFSQFSKKVFQNTKIEETNQTKQEEEVDITEDNFLFTDINAKLIWKPNEKNTIALSSLFVSNELNFAAADDENNQSSDVLSLVNNGYSLVWKSQLSATWKLSSNLYYSNYESTYNFLETIEGAEDGERFDKFNSVKDIGIIAQISYQMNSMNNLNFGLDFTNYNVDYILNVGEVADEEENESESLSSQSLFIEHAYKSEKWYVRTGLRTSYLNEINTFLEPRFYADYQINKQLKLKLSGEIKNQSIAQLISFEFNDLGLDNTVWVLADNDEIPVLNNRQVTAGFLIDKKGWKIDVEGYYKKIKGLTSFTKGFNTNVEDYESGISEIYGLDILIKKRIKKFRTWLSYSLSKNNYTFKEIQNNPFPGNFDQRHSLTFSNTYKLKQVQFSLGWYFASGKPYSKPSGLQTVTDEENNQESVLVFDNQNNKRLAAYHKLDASVVYNFSLDKAKRTKAKVGISFINIYNRKNQIDKDFDVSHGEVDEIEEKTLLGLGFTPNLLFRVGF
ncbi:TonB-dependent receptor plug domain-containing protein [Wenyingzhuangia sp. IMCC45574]